MDCEKASLLMMMFLDGTIGEFDRLRLQDHMDECEHCRQEFSLLLESIDLIDSIEEVEPPQELEALVMSNIDLKRYKRETRTITWILRVTVIFGMIGGILAYLAISNPAVFKQAIISGVIKLVNFAVLNLPGILVMIEENFTVLMGIGIGILAVLFSSILMLALAEYYVVEKLKINFRGGVK